MAAKDHLDRAESLLSGLSASTQGQADSAAMVTILTALTEAAMAIAVELGVPDMLDQSQPPSAA